MKLEPISHMFESQRRGFHSRCGSNYYNPTRQEKISSSYWNNPHICDAVKKEPTKVMCVPKVRRNQQEMIRKTNVTKSAMDKNKIRTEKMENDKNRALKRRNLKYASQTSLTEKNSRNHVTIQTCKYLEELYDIPVTSNTCLQTDFEFNIDLPPFIPGKSGVDTYTQIYQDDLFYFDEEVKPILEVTTGRTIEQALLEVLHEDELEGMEKERRKFMEKKSAEEAEIQRLLEEERRKNKEKEKRLAELELAREQQKELKERIAATVISENGVKEMIPEILQDMITEGYYVDLLESEVRDDIMKMIEDDIFCEVNCYAQSRDILNKMIENIVQERYDVYTELGENPVSRFSKELSSVSLPEVLEDENLENDLVDGEM